MSVIVSMTQSYSTATKDLNYLLDLVRGYRARAEAARNAAANNELQWSYYQFAGEAIALARIEGHIEGILSVNEICGK